MIEGKARGVKAYRDLHPQRLRHIYLKYFNRNMRFYFVCKVSGRTAVVMVKGSVERVTYLRGIAFIQ